MTYPVPSSKSLWFVLMPFGVKKDPVNGLDIDFAVADLTTANVNVFYELGVRHAVRPATTLLVFVSNQTIPFDLNFIRALPYTLAFDNGFSSDEAANLATNICNQLTALKKLQARGEVQDSPIFQLLQDYGKPDISRLKTDVFRDQAQYAADIKKSLAHAREEGNAEAVHRIEESQGENLQTTEAPKPVSSSICF